MLYGIVCSVCHRRGLAPIDDDLADAYVSRHGWTLCTDHADRVDPRYPDDPQPLPFMADSTDTGPLRR